ncbi:hypothetical protein [Actinomadura sp.]|jgi:hypothetical protein|uniref:hypothetical protein n=1 Tax=Actinomadura sp. TaxID=1989 RepID=UPI003348720E
MPQTTSDATRPFKLPRERLAAASSSRRDPRLDWVNDELDGPNASAGFDNRFHRHMGRRPAGIRAADRLRVMTTAPM